MDGNANDAIPDRMCAALLTGHGGFDRLVYRTDVPVPRPGAGEVLIRVEAAGVNNTDINTRIGWYSKAVRTGSSAGGSAGLTEADGADGSWTGAALRFPRIQGADCCGHIVAVGDGVSRARIGERVIVAPLLRHYRRFRPFEADTLGSEIDGAFAQYAKAPSCETFHVACDWSSVELASMPCAYSTAENMLARAALGAERVLITGASGGVGSAAVQLAKRRGARVTAQVSASKQKADWRSGRMRQSSAMPMSSQRSGVVGSTSWWTWSAASAGHTCSACCAPAAATSVPVPSPVRSARWTCARCICVT